AMVPHVPAPVAAEAKYRFPQFLGARRDGRVDDVRLARDWTAAPPKELWRHPVGLGWSGFVVADGLAITQEQVGEDELVTACALLTGTPIWAHTNHTRFREWQGGDGPRATPTIVDHRVYTYGATGILNCLDLATGRLRWSVDVLETNGLHNLTWGKSSAPLVADGRVIVSGGTSPEKGWLAYDADTGKPLWSANGEAANYASAAAATLAGRPQILVSGPQAVAGLDPATGVSLWRFAWGSDKPPKCSQPLVLNDDRVFLSAGYAMGCVLIQVRAAADGSLQAAELWRAKSMKTQFNNVAVRDGHLYGLDDGFLACVEVATGKRLWKDGRYGSGQSLLVGDLLLVQAEAGFVALAEAKPEGFNELGRISALDSKTWNNPALAGPYLLVRNDHEAACYELPLAAGPTAAR
ncbi:MAG TPA: PQQ-binding-like beta-propeller repeat protein, partial [Candidatus Limnocylindria bacterium]|nr:PQQ-binding-like beta-propeller repeat protein [Candidatus Limnocylindria bacterium]